MDLDQLQSVRDRERQTDRLQQLRDSFYEEAAEFVRELRAEREEAAAAADDPFDAPRVTRLTDRIRTAEQTLEAIYEKRVGKVVKAATFAAADLPAEAEGMTREETELFETLVDEIEENRETVLGRLGDDEVGADVFGDGPETASEETAGEQDAGVNGGAAGPTAASPDDEADGLGAADVMGEDPAAGGPEPTPPEPPEPPAEAAARAGGDEPTADDPSVPADAPAADGDASPDDNTDGGETPDAPLDAPPDPPVDGPEAEGPDADGPDADVPDADGPTADGQDPDDDVERELVRITDDVGPILGVDEREYDLSADDVVTLPTENARPLVERGVAERLE